MTAGQAPPHLTTGVDEAPTSFAVFENGICFVEPGTVPSPPAAVLFEGHVFRRFMDFIYLPAPADDLTRDQLITVNRLRAHLVEMCLLAPANARVKDRLVNAIRTLGAGSVLEWGCGYRSIESRLSVDVSYTATDVDPDVVRYQTAHGTRCFLADELAREVYMTEHDVVLGVFVFHFDIPDRHIAAMHRLLGPDGLVLANIYRRTKRSRAKLRDAFEAHRFRVLVRPDPDRLCRAHEYWVLHKDTRHSKARALMSAL